VKKHLSNQHYINVQRVL